MGKIAVREIRREIDHLVDKDRLLLERELTLRLETEWRTESRKARTRAKRDGIDQSVIDHAIERRRYGR